jgi:hypothetical protein
MSFGFKALMLRSLSGVYKKQGIKNTADVMACFNASYNPEPIARF